VVIRKREVGIGLSDFGIEVDSLTARGHFPTALRHPRGPRTAPGLGQRRAAGGCRRAKDGAGRERA